jgi:hypothetical protein
MVTETLSAASRPVRVRLPGLDRVRGLAVALMAADHLLYVTHGPAELRHTVTRVAMPLFALVAGYLVRRLSLRWLWVFTVGAALPVAVPWIDNPNILCELAAGAVVCVAARRWRYGPLLAFGVLAWALTIAANGYAVPVGSYQLTAVVGLMLLGQHSGDLLAGIGGRWLPGWLAGLGRYPLTVYVGHLLAIQLVLLSL